MKRIFLLMAAMLLCSCTDSKTPASTSEGPTVVKINETNWSRYLRLSSTPVDYRNSYWELNGVLTYAVYDVVLYYTFGGPVIDQKRLPLDASGYGRTEISLTDNGITFVTINGTVTYRL